MSSPTLKSHNDMGIMFPNNPVALLEEFSLIQVTRAPLAGKLFFSADKANNYASETSSVLLNPKLKVKEG